MAMSNSFFPWYSVAAQMTKERIGDGRSLEDILTAKLREYFDNMKDEKITGLHTTILEMIERPLIILALEKTDYNRAQAAKILGIHRNTLLKKIEGMKISLKPKGRTVPQKGRTARST